jgi:hypothetical protein
MAGNEANIRAGRTTQIVKYGLMHENVPEFDFHPAPDTVVFAYSLDL